MKFHQLKKVSKVPNIPSLPALIASLLCIFDIRTAVAYDEFNLPLATQPVNKDREEVFKPVIDFSENKFPAFKERVKNLTTGLESRSVVDVGLITQEQLEGMQYSPVKYQEVVRSKLGPISGKLLDEQNLNDAWKEFSRKAWENDRYYLMDPLRSPATVFLYDKVGRRVLENGYEMATGALLGRMSGSLASKLFGDALSSALKDPLFAKLDGFVREGIEAKRAILAHQIQKLGYDLDNILLLDEEGARKLLSEIINRSPDEVKDLTLSKRDGAGWTVGDVKDAAEAAKADPGLYNAKRFKKSMQKMRDLEELVTEIGKELNLKMDAVLELQAKTYKGITDANAKLDEIQSGLKEVNTKVDALTTLLPPSLRISMMAQGRYDRPNDWKGYCGSSEGKGDSNLQNLCSDAFRADFGRDIENFSGLILFLGKAKLIDGPTTKFLNDIAVGGNTALGVWAAISGNNYGMALGMVGNLLGGGAPPSPEQQMLRQVFKQLNVIMEQLKAIVTAQIQIYTAIQDLSFRVEESNRRLYDLGQTTLFSIIQQSFGTNFEGCRQIINSAQENFGMNAGFFPNYDVRARHYQESMLSAGNKFFSRCIVALDNAAAIIHRPGASQASLPLPFWIATDASDLDRAFRDQYFKPILDVTMRQAALEENFPPRQLPCEHELINILSAAPLAYSEIKSIPGKCGTPSLPRTQNPALQSSSFPPLGLYALSEPLRFDNIMEVSAYQRFFAPYEMMICRDADGGASGDLVEAGTGFCKTRAPGRAAMALTTENAVHRLRATEMALQTFVAQEAMLSGVYLAPWLFEELLKLNFNNGDSKLADLKQARDILARKGLSPEELEKWRISKSKALDALEVSEAGASVCKHSSLQLATLCAMMRSPAFAQNFVLYGVLTTLQKAQVGSDRSRPITEKAESISGFIAPGIPDWKPSPATASSYIAALSLKSDWMIRQVLPGLPIVRVSKDDEPPKWVLRITDHQGDQVDLELPDGEKVQMAGINYSPAMFQAAEEWAAVKQLRIALDKRSVRNFGLNEKSAGILLFGHSLFRVDRFAKAPLPVEQQPGLPNNPESAAIPLSVVSKTLPLTTNGVEK